ALALALALLVPLAAPRAEGPTPAGRGDPALVEAFGKALADEALKGARIGLYVVRLPGGEPIFERNAAERLHPASNTKLVTTAAAFSLLGPAYTWHTDLAVDSLGDKGEAGTLYLIGGGDPRFVSESLWRLVEDARLAGLTRVKGDLVVDETWLGPQHEAPGYADKAQDAAYRAPSGATTLNWNSVSIRVVPGAAVGKPPVVTIEPGEGYVELRNTATTSRKGAERLTVSAKAEGGRTRITVGGRIPLKHRGITVRRRIDDPALFAGYAARAMLKAAGIEVKGKVKAGEAPKKRRRLARVRSRTLAMMAADVNKLSNNVMAEHLLRTLGREKGAAGDWDAGRAVVTDFLTKTVGIRGFTYRNGSGLFGDTAFSAKEMVAVLRHMHTRTPALPEYAASLAIGGLDGTLRRRMKGFPPLAVRAKTGTLSGVIALSGYVTFADGSMGAFSFLFNDVKARPWVVWKAQDAMAKTLTAWSPPGKGR
ncbi:MAG: D-alanyl-D-alanine carboxypeptidase/D-alanyl-D-alanine-endopeptidase, partial [Myxococcales bacterium]|nr:D-alanyl-D-alanine carboxypeptidase/D-alanyl-D-alanine-endopeptidase [Myxococcales bacterium]